MAFLPRDEDLNHGVRQMADLWAPLFLVFLGILFFSDPLFSSKNFYFRDILNFHYPLRKVLIGSYARGEFPLWNPFIYLGQPMLANPNYMAFYPTNILHLLLPFNYAFKLHFILHPLFAGLGLYFLLRRLGLNAIPSVAGGIAYEFSGTVLSFLNLYNIIPAVALLPWIGWAFAGALEKNWLRRSLIFGGLLGLQVIAFEPMMFLCGLWLLAGISVFYLVESNDRIGAALRSLKTGIVGGLFGAALAAVQVLPTLELLPRSGRGAGFDFNEVGLWSMHPLDLLSSVIPNLFGNYYTLGLATSWGEAIHNGRESYLVSFFLGTCSLLLVALSFLSHRRKLQVVTAGLAAVSLTLALGKYNPVYHWLFQHVGLLRVGRYPSKYFLLTALALSILAALGLEVILHPERLSAVRRRGLFIVGIIGLVTGLALLGYSITWQQHVQQLQQWVSAGIEPTLIATKDIPGILSNLRLAVLSSGLFLAIASSLVLIAPAWQRASLLGALMLVLMAAELLPANLRLSPLIADVDVDFVPEVNSYLKRNISQEPHRVVPPTMLRPMPDLKLQVPNRSSAWLTLFYRMSGQPLYGIMDGIQYSLDRSVDHLNTFESEDLWKACSALPESDALTLLAKLNSPMILLIGEIKDPRVRLLSSFDTRSNLKLNLYWLDNTVTRALFVSNVQKAGTHDEALRRFLSPGFPLGNSVILEDVGAGESAGQPASGVARIVRYENQRISCQVEADGAGYLVLLDSYYPGWNAYVDGNETKILRANYAFRAVAIPAGKHQVDFRYHPTVFYAGLSLSLVTLGCGIFLFLNRPRRSHFAPKK